MEWQEQDRVRLSWPDRLDVDVPYQLAKKLRAPTSSWAPWRPGLARPGCRFRRMRHRLPPMDLHLKGLSAMGFEVE